MEGALRIKLYTRERQTERERERGDKREKREEREERGERRERREKREEREERGERREYPIFMQGCSRVSSRRGLFRAQVNLTAPSKPGQPTALRKVGGGWGVLGRSALKQIRSGRTSQNLCTWHIPTDQTKIEQHQVLLGLWTCRVYSFS